jgi:hypothetical protein
VRRALFLRTDVHPAAPPVHNNKHKHLSKKYIDRDIDIMSVSRGCG